MEELLTKISQGLLTNEDIPLLETLLNGANKAYADGEPIIEDSIYDVLRGALEKIDPENSLVKDTWEQSIDGFKNAVGQYGELLEKNPMLSIKTVKSFADDYFTDYCNRVANRTLHFSYKVNGHGIRAVYEDGKLVSATSRARGGHGDDLLPLMKNVMPSELPLEGVVEIRGELCIKIANLDKAREYNPGIKSPLSAITSLKAAPPEYQKLMTVLCYGYYADGVEFTTKAEEYQKLEFLGLETPGWAVVEYTDDSQEVIKTAFAQMEEMCTFEYFYDGVVVTLNDYAEYHQMPLDGAYSLGSMALKIGKWSQVGYTGVIDHFEWLPGKTVLTPIAVVFDPESGEDGVLVSEGFRVRNVPLYNLAVILQLELDVGSVVHFNYGGEAGVVPVDEAGNTVSAK